MQVSHKQTDNHLYTIEEVEKNIFQEIFTPATYKILVDGEVEKYYDTLDEAKDALSDLIEEEDDD